MKKVILSAPLALLACLGFAQASQDVPTDGLSAEETIILSQVSNMPAPFQVAANLSTGYIKTPDEDYAVNIMIGVCHGYFANVEAVVLSLVFRNIEVTKDDMEDMEAEVAYAEEWAAYPVTSFSAEFGDQLQDIGHTMAENLIQQGRQGLDQYTDNLRGCFGVLENYTTYIDAMNEYANLPKNKEI